MFRSQLNGLTKTAKRSLAHSCITYHVRDPVIVPHVNCSFFSQKLFQAICSHFHSITSKKKRPSFAKNTDLWKFSNENHFVNNLSYKQFPIPIRDRGPKYLLLDIKWFSRRKNFQIISSLANPYVKNWELFTHSWNFSKMVLLNTLSYLRSTSSNPIRYIRRSHSQYHIDWLQYQYHRYHSRIAKRELYLPGSC